MDRHTSRMVDRVLEDLPDFTRCPNPGCASGQIHEGGDGARPVVSCAACGTTFCFRHRVQLDPASSPHGDMSCSEYDAYIADPLGFRSDHERRQEHQRREAREHEAVRRARGRFEEEVRRRRRAPGERDRDREAAREEAERVERARRERVLYEEERTRVDGERRKRAEEIERRRLEDLQSERRIEVSTKGCPRCAARIEKNEGW